MAAAAQVSPAVQNAYARQNLIQTGLYGNKQLAPVTASALGQQVKIMLPRVGIATGVMLQVTVPVNITVAATASPFCPFNLANLITFTDFAGLQRVVTNGFQLHALNMFKSGNSMGNALNYANLTASEVAIDTGILHVPTGVANTDSLKFFVYVPFAYDPKSDLRGALISQTVTGDQYITITLPNALVGTDPWVFPYTAGTAVLGAANGGVISVTGFYHYIQPQNGFAMQNLPMIDLSTVYAIEGNLTDSSNITAGQNKFLQWPNNRAIMSALHFYNQAATGGTLNGADLSQIVLLGNSNTNIRELTPEYLRMQQRFITGTDLPSGVYYLGTRDQPISTQLMGNVQTQFGVVTAAASSYFASQFESTYLTGTPLPGVLQ
jgi:hypothetical protein